MSSEKIMLVILLATIVVHLGKFLDWLLGPMQTRIKRDALTELNVFVQLSEPLQVFRYITGLVSDFFDRVFGARILASNGSSERRFIPPDLQYPIQRDRHRSIIPIFVDPPPSVFSETGAIHWAMVVFFVVLALIQSTSFYFIFDLPSLALVHFIIKNLQTSSTINAVCLMLLLLFILVLIFWLAPIIAFTLTSYRLAGTPFWHFDDPTGFLNGIDFNYVFFGHLLDRACRGTSWIVPPKYLAEFLGCPYWSEGPQTELYAIPTLVPGISLLVITSIGMIVRYAWPILRRPLVFLTERLQASPSGIFTQVSAVGAAVAAIFALFR